MLQHIRDKAQGWIAWAIVILISIPFALWGIQEYLGIGSEPVVASVNGNEITQRALDQRFETFRQEMREQLGAAYRPEMFEDERMKQEVLKRMVREDVIMQSSHDLGLRAGDPLVRQAILGIDTFKKNGSFDQEVYERSVRMQGLSTAGFEQRVRRILLQNQLSAAVQGGAFVTDYELKQAVRLSKQTRDIAYFELPTKDFTSEEEIPEADIQAYYEQHKESYRSPEKVKVEFILLDGNSVGKTIEVDDDLLQTHYNSTLDKYGVEEQRQASHILITLPEDADQAALAEARSKLEELRARAEAGEDFAELATANSQDPGSAPEGGDLGYFGKGVMDPAFEEAVFSLEEGALSQPVRSSFGLHLIKLTGIKPSSVKSFDEVQGDVERDYRKTEAERRYDEMAVRLADLSYEDPSSLQPAAEGLNVPVSTSDWFDRNGGVGVLRNPKVVAAAFSDDVLNGHNNSELIELDHRQSIVLRVIDHRESSYQPLLDVQHKIVEAINNERAADKVKAEAESRLERLKSGETLAQVAGDYEVTSKEGLERGDRTQPAALLQAVFRATRPEEGKAVSGLARLGNGNYAVYSLSAVKDGTLEGLDEKIQQAARSNLRQEVGQTQFDHLVDDLERRADIAYLKASDAK